MAIFWVNQGYNFAIEQEEHRLHYDPIGDNGHHKPGYKNISNVRCGDFILHNDNSFIRAISVATSDCYIIRKETAEQGRIRSLPMISGMTMTSMSMSVS